MMHLLLAAAAALDLLLPKPQFAAAREGTVAFDAPVTVVRAAVADAPSEAADGAYLLEIAPTGVTITAASEAGVRYARATLGQLKALVGGATDGDVRCPGGCATDGDVRCPGGKRATDGDVRCPGLPCCRIVDWPARDERGIVCDCDRDGLTVADLMTRVDVMALYKMNVLALRPTKLALGDLERHAAARGIAIRKDVTAPAAFTEPENPFDLLSYLAFGPDAAGRVPALGDCRTCPAIAGLAEALWTGRRESRPEFLGRLPLPGTPAFAAVEALERRLIAQRDAVFAEMSVPFPFVGQTRMRWRVSNGATGSMCATDVPQATVWTFDERTPANAFSFADDPSAGVVFETWIRNPKEESFACWVGAFRSADGAAVADARLILNGESVTLPAKRTVLDLRIRTGLNHVAIILPRAEKGARTSCGVTFCPFGGPVAHPWEIDAFAYSAKPPLAAFEQRWGANRLWGAATHGRRFRDIAVEEGHRYVVVTAPATDGLVRVADAANNELRRFRLAESKYIRPPRGGTSATIDLDGEADVIVWEFSQEPAVPVPYPDAVGYSDETTDEPTDRFQRAIDAAAARGGGTVRVPAGVWHVKPLELKSNVTLELAEGAVLLASLNPADYPSEQMRRSFILAEDATNVTIRGKGILDGRGYAFRETGRRMGPESQPQALPRLLKFNRCVNLRLEDFTYRRSGSWGCHLCDCDGVAMRRVKCFNHVNKMNDGVDIESRNVLVEDCDIDADDDGLVLKAETDKRFAVTNVVVRNCRLASMAYPFKIGTGSYTDVSDVLVENCELKRTRMNHRFPHSKWTIGVTNDISGFCGIGLQCVDGGRLSNVTVRNCTVDGYHVPFAIRLGRRHAPNDPRGSWLRNVLIENVTGAAEGPTASSVTGVPGLEPENIVIRNVHFTIPGGATEADARAYVFENEKGYPGPNMFRSVLPAAGVYIRHAPDVRLENVTFRTLRPDARPLVVRED